MLVFAAFAWCLVHLVAARWVHRDALRRGFDGLHAVVLVSLLWPLGLPLWFMIRSGLHLAPKGRGSAWG